MTNTTHALTANWLEQTQTGNYLNCDYQTKYNYYQYPNYWPWVTQTITVTAQPIKLTLKEVDTLRALAKEDKKLKTILEKFTPLIEVIVDFE